MAQTDYADREYAQLEPLSHDHHAGLVKAIEDGNLYEPWYTFMPEPEEVTREIDRRLGLRFFGSMMPFTVFDSEDRIVGMTTYMTLDAAHRNGATWYSNRVQRTPLNTQCKTAPSESCLRGSEVQRSRIRHAFFNHRSRRAIERLGAKRDGILRNHQIAPNGTLRDTVVYSIIASEWETVKAHLTYQLEGKHFDITK